MMGDSAESRERSRDQGWMEARFTRAARAFVFTSDFHLFQTLFTPDTLLIPYSLCPTIPRLRLVIDLAQRRKRPLRVPES